MKLRISLPVIVEGRYDKIKLSSLLDAQIVTTDGFRVFNDREKRAYLKRLCENGVIIATDSDKAGELIRGHLKGILPGVRIINVYIPQVAGKEKRKSAPSAEGFLGVEGTNTETLLKLFSPYEGGTVRGAGIDRARLYELGLCGRENSAEKRAALCRLAGLPPTLSSKALCAALGSLYTPEELEALLTRLGTDKE